MDIFIINLKKDIAKKEIMLAQLTTCNIKNYSFYEAIDGEDLSESEIKDKVYDYPGCQLTRGEIACALSHYNIYKMMVHEKITSAIILEDDIQISSIFKNIIPMLEKTMNRTEAKILSLGKISRLLKPRNRTLLENLKEYTVVSGSGAYAYCINFAAAKNLINNLMPIKYEADMFRYFRENGWIEDFNAVYPQIIKTIPNHDEVSNIYTERYSLVRERRQYLNNLLKKRPLKIRFQIKLRRFFWRFRQVRVNK